MACPMVLHCEIQHNLKAIKVIKSGFMLERLPHGLLPGSRLMFLHLPGEGGGGGMVDGPRLNRHVHTINYLTRVACRRV